MVANMAELDMAVVRKQRCEICKVLFIEDYGFSIVATWCVTGRHLGVIAYDCGMSHPGQVQHWGCTAEHAMQALLQCLQHDDKMSVNALLEKHRQADSDGHPKVAEQFRELYETKGESFHILTEGDTHGDGDDQVRGADTSNGGSDTTNGNQHVSG